MQEQPAFAEKLVEWLNWIWDQAMEWLNSPAAWSQFALLAAAYIAAKLLTRRLIPAITPYLTPKPDSTGMLTSARLLALSCLPLVLPLLAYALTAMGEGLTRATFGSGDVIAFGKRVFLFLAARALVKEVLTEGFLNILGRYVLLPVAALYALGLLDEVTIWLDEAKVNLGHIQFSALSLIRGAIAGAVLFWLGGWSNRHSAEYIRTKEDLRPATRELARKTAEVAIFGASFLLLMSIMGIDLTAVAVLGGALGVGIGLGLQQIAANFVSGIILLLEGQTTVGDYVELDGGEKGTIVKMTARACILETIDGRWIVVPNDNFIVSRVVNYSDAGKLHRYSASFSVSYETDINPLPELIETAVAQLECISASPSGPSCELVAFGENGIEFEVEYWVSGIEDLTDDYNSKVLFCIWNTLKAAGIKMPYPQRVVHLKTDAPMPAPKTPRKAQASS